ncbi:MAG: hypothetical protein CVU45_01760, partial [Chloroflexi bacterium HGW-Chloroflexi-7]
ASLDFIVGRLKNSLTDQGFRYDVVDAVLAEQHSNPAGVIRAVRELSAWVNHADWATILPAYARCVRITRDQKMVFVVDPANFEEKSEEALFKEIEKVEKLSRKEGSVDDLIKAFQPVIPAVNQFFDAVLVMAENEKVRTNRLGMLQRIAALAKGIADFSCLEGF